MEWIKNKKNKILVAVISVICVVVACVVAVVLASDKKDDNEPSSQGTSINQTTELPETSETPEEPQSSEAESNSEPDNSNNETPTQDKNNNNNNGGSTQKPSNNKITYITGEALLKINGERIYMPQYSYIAFNSEKLYKGKDVSYSVMSMYAPQKYFDESVDNYAVMNKAIELEKEIYWTNMMAKKYGITPSSPGGYYDTSWTNNEVLANVFISRYSNTSRQIINKMLADGTLKPDLNARNEIIRRTTWAYSQIDMKYAHDMPAEIVEAEKAYVRSVFGKEGVNSSELSSAVNKDLSARADKIEAETGLYFDYSVTYQPVSMLSGVNGGVDASEYNVAFESEEKTTPNYTTFTIKMNYDPVNHLNVSEADIHSLDFEAVIPQFIKLKKKAIDNYTVGVNKDAYIEWMKTF